MLKIRKGTKPKIHTVKDAYQHYASGLLKNNQDYWGKREGMIKNRHIYKKTGDSIIEIMSHDKYRDIISNFFKAASTDLMEGKKLNLLNNSGYLFIKRIERSFKKPRVNWGESNKQKQEHIDNGDIPLKGNNGGKPWLIYFTDDEYFRLAWARPIVGMKHTNFYKFIPARGREGKEGFKEQMAHLIKARPELKDRYLYQNIKGERVT